MCISSVSSCWGSWRRVERVAPSIDGKAAQILAPAAVVNSFVEIGQPQNNNQDDQWECDKTKPHLDELVSL